MGFASASILGCVWQDISFHKGSRLKTVGLGSLSCRLLVPQSPFLFFIMEVFNRVPSCGFFIQILLNVVLPRLTLLLSDAHCTWNPGFLTTEWPPSGVRGSEGDVNPPSRKFLHPTLPLLSSLFLAWGWSCLLILTRHPFAAPGALG